MTAHVRYWPKADMGFCTAHVRFRGQSGHRKSCISLSFFSPNRANEWAEI
jgi:hypothetical protein